MIGIILAAGSGRRLRIHKPKGMLNIGGQPLIDYSLNNLSKSGITSVLVVTGFKSEIYHKHFLQNRDVFTVHNDEYNNCGSLYSLYLALKKVQDEDVVILDSDILYNWDEFKSFIDDETPNSIFATNVPEGRHDACYIQTDLSNNLVKISKNINAINFNSDDQAWEHIGIIKTSKSSIPLILDYAEKLFATTGSIDHEYDYAFENIGIPYKVLKYTDYVWTEADDNEQLNYMTSIVYPKITIP